MEIHSDVQRPGPLTISLNALAIFSMGLGLTGWLSPVTGVCFMGLAVIYLVWQLLSMGWLRKNVPFMLRLLAAVMLLSVVAGTSIPRVQSKLRHSENTDVKRVAVASPVFAALMVRPDVMQLPVAIAPLSTAYLLELNPAQPRWTSELPNPTSKPLFWPAPPKPTKKPQDPVLVYRWTISNHGNRELLNVSLFFGVHFHNLQEMPLDVQVHGSRASVHVPWAGTDPYVRLGIVVGKGKIAKLIYPGGVASEHRHEVVIPAIAPGHEVNLYFLNRSGLFTLFDFPENASALVLGNRDRGLVDLIRPNVNPLDTAPKMGLPPADLGGRDHLTNRR